MDLAVVVFLTQAFNLLHSHLLRNHHLHNLLRSWMTPISILHIHSIYLSICTMFSQK